MKEILETIRQVSQGHWFLYMFPAALAVLLVLMKGRRRLIWPLGLLALVVCNPLFFRVWNRLDLYAYWRMLWVLPVLPVMAAIPAAVSEKIGEGKKLCRAAAVLACIGVFAFTGTFLYTGPGGKFALPAENREKLPDGAKLIADYLLSLDDHPRVIADFHVSVYLRQMNGQIETLYGRDVEGYILSADSDIRKLDRQIRDPEGDLSSIPEIMLNDGYEYLVLRDYGREEKLKELRFEMLAHYAGYGIYIVHGTPTEQKEWNELGQVIRKTYVNPDGTPRVQAGGYCSVEYAYDRNGYVCREFYRDADGHGVMDASGRAGYERVLDRRGHVLSEKSLDVDGQVAGTRSGYAEIRREYAGGRVSRESFHDADGKPVMTGAGYAEVRRRWQGDECVQEHFFDESGNPVMGSGGYASMEKTLDRSGHVLSVTYLGTDGRPVLCTAGYAWIENTWENGGKLLETWYLDAQGLRCSPDGYAGFREQDTPEGRVRTYLDESGAPVVRKEGYAAVRWTRKDGEVQTCLEFLDANGQPMFMEGKNLVEQAYPVWSEWFSPSSGRENVNITVGSVNLGGQKAGDQYTCQVEIEFLGVSGTEGRAFSFRAQGAQDGRWFTGNIWNGGLILLDTPPEDGVYVLTSTQTVTEGMEGISTFDLGFRCDYWNSGAFRIRRVKIEKGDAAHAWTGGL